MPYKAGKSPSLGNRQHGYALMLALVLLVAGSLYAFVSRLESGTREKERRTDTALSLQQAREALLAYAVTYRERYPDASGAKIEGIGYLPCPDLSSDDGLSMTGVSASNCGSVGASSIGLLPTRSLGLPDLRDSDGNCLWYAVSGPHKGSGKASPFNWDTRGQFEIIEAGGSSLLALDGDDGGAVAIIFAPGAPLSNQNRTAINKPCGTDSTQAAAYLESLGPQFIQGQRKTPDGNLTTNDQLAWISAREISMLARKRNDFANHVNAHIAAVWNDLAANLGARTPKNGIELPNDNPFVVDSSNYKFYENWADQFRYYRCNPSGAFCYTSSNGTRCDALLLMAGSGIHGNAEWSTNVAAQEAKGASFSGAARNQAPGDPRRALRRSNLDYFEDQLAFVSAPSSGRYLTNPSYSVSQGSRDLGMCLRFMLQGFQGFVPLQTNPAQPIVSVGSPSAIPTDSPTQLRLGNSSGTAQFGCTWHGDSVTLDRPLRVHFRFRINDVGEGFTFALAGTTGNPSTRMCGGVGSALGYSGNNDITLPIELPKLALEIDTRSLAGTPSSNDRNDPVGPHAAFVFWAGNQRSDNIDNRHGACNADSSVCNPNTFLPLPSSDLALEPYHVRLDIQPNSGGGLQLTAYVLQESMLTTSCPLSDLDQALPPSCVTGRLATTLTLPPALPMPYAWLGFTVGQGSGADSSQEIVIDQFVVRGN